MEIDPTLKNWPMPSCCGQMEPYRVDEINGTCPKCGEYTVDGNSIYGCTYSPVICEECQDSPCDGSC